jgi:hypothetical protein
VVLRHCPHPFEWVASIFAIAQKKNKKKQQHKKSSLKLYNDR